jgi:DNA-binding protein YbaB
MKTINVLLMALVAGLVACSNGGGGGGNAPKGQTDFEPARKPANAVSKEDLKYYQTLNATAAQYLPQDEAVFTTVLSGSKADPVKPEKLQESLARLNADGQQIVRMMKTRCNILDALSTVTGDTEMRVGAAQEEKGNMAVTDTADCPYLMNKSAQTNSVITAIDGDAKNVNIKSTAVMTEKTNRVVRSDYLQYRTQVLSSAMQMATNAKTEVSFSQEKITMKAVVNGSGTVAYEMVNGDYMRGPVTVEATIDSATEKMSVQSLLDMQTPRGAIRIVMIGTEAGQEMYINGEKVNPGDFETIVQATRSPMKEAARLETMAKELK